MLLVVNAGPAISKWLVGDVDLRWISNNDLRLAFVFRDRPCNADALVPELLIGRLLKLASVRAPDDNSENMLGVRLIEI